MMVPWAKKYSQFCSMHSLNQLIRSPTRVAKATSNLPDHILTNANELVSQSGVLDIGLSDQQLVFCTIKKQKKSNMYKHETIKTRSLKNMLQRISVINLMMLSLQITLNSMM